MLKETSMDTNNHMHIKLYVRFLKIEIKMRSFKSSEHINGKGE